MLQTPRKLSLPVTRSQQSEGIYVPAGVASSAMIKFLALAAKEMREQAERRRYEVASSPSDRLDPSTIYRFEKGRWPENADRVVDLYAADLGVEPIVIWKRALELWRAAERAQNDGLNTKRAPTSHR